MTGNYLWQSTMNYGVFTIAIPRTLEVGEREYVLEKCLQEFEKSAAPPSKNDAASKDRTTWQQHIRTFCAGWVCGSR